MSNRPANYESTKRILKLYALLEQNGGSMPLSDACRLLSVGDKTIERYVEAFGAPPEEQDGAPQLSLKDTERGPQLTLHRSSTEVSPSVFRYLAVHASTAHLRRLDPGVLGAESVQVLDQLKREAGLEKNVLSAINKSFYYHPFGPKNYKNKEKILQKIIQALLYRHELVVRYHSHDKDPKSYQFFPWYLMIFRDGLYLWGIRAEDRVDLAAPKPTRCFALDRILEVSLGAKGAFRVPHSFDPERYHQDHFGITDAESAPEEIVLAFHPERIPWVRERSWPGSPFWTKTKDGRELLHLHLSWNREFVSWLLGWGDGVEVLAPDELRCEVAQRLSVANMLYNKQPSSEEA